MPLPIYFVAKARSEPRYIGRWGLYHVNKDRMLGLIFGTQWEAMEAARELNEFQVKWDGRYRGPFSDDDDD